jgi:hypothetical protein
MKKLILFLIFTASTVPTTAQQSPGTANAIQVWPTVPVSCPVGAVYIVNGALYICFTINTPTAINGGGSGNVTTSGSVTSGNLSEFSGATAITNSPLADNGTSVNSSEVFNAPQISTNGPPNSWFTGTGSLIGFNEGTCSGTIPALTDWFCDSSTGLDVSAGGTFHSILYNGATFNATTATGLQTYPTLCSGGQLSRGLSSGSNNCINTSSNPNGYGMWQLTIPTNLTNWMNQGSSVSVNGTNFVSIVAPNSSGASLRVLNAACPSGFTNGTLDLYALVVGGSGNYEAATNFGIEIDDGTKLVTMGENTNTSAANTITTDEWNTTTSYNTNLNSSGGSWPWQPIWWHVHDASGTLTFDYSYNGLGTPNTNGSWNRITSSTNGGLSAVTNCGFYINATTSPFGGSSILLSWAFLSSLTAQ